MYKEEHQQWRTDAKNALAMVYQPAEVNDIISWMDTIKASRELELVGDDVLQCLQIIADNDKHWNLYNNMMMRMWLYAPYIIAERK